MSSIFLGMTVIHRRNEKQMLCKIWARVFVCFDGPSAVVNNSGGSRGGARGARPLPSLVLDQTKALRAEKNFFPDHPPLSKVQDDRLPLSQGLDPALNKLVIEGLNCTKLPTGEIGSQSENSIYFSLRTCESRHIILSLWRLGGDLIHFFTDFLAFPAFPANRERQEVTWPVPWRQNWSLTPTQYKMPASPVAGHVLK